MKKLLLLPLLILLAAVLWPQKVFNSSPKIFGIFDASEAAITRPDRVVSSDPATCATGDTVYRSDTQRSRRCIAPNTWADDGGNTYTLPTASAVTLGGVKVGSGLAIDGGGVLSASGGSGGCDPTDKTLACVIEDFVGGTTTSGQVGSVGAKWSAVSSGTLGYLGLSTNTLTQHPGVVSITSTTAANSGGTLQLGNTASVQQFNVADLMSKDWSVMWIVKLPSTSDVRVRVGIGSQDTNLAPSTGGWHMYFRYDTDAAFGDNAKNGGSGSWVSQFCGYNSGSCADTSGVYHVSNTAPATNWTELKISRVSSTDTYTWSVNGTAVSTMCGSGCNMTTPTVSNQSASSAAPIVAFGISSTTQRALWIDWAFMKLAGITRY